MKNNLIKKLFPNYQTKKELREKIKILEFDAMTNAVTRNNELENLKIYTKKIRKIFNAGTPNFIIEDIMCEEITNYIRDNNLAKIEIEAHPITENKHCSAEVRILPYKK